MTIYQQGQVNTTAQVVPDLIVQILAPGTALLNGVPTNILGIVGTASWGPVNAASIGGSMQDYARIHGPIMNRKYDMGTVVAAATLQGAANFRFSRVTDGTDMAASAVVLTNCITFTAKYTGSLGNSLQVTLSPGSQASTQKVVVSLPGYNPEVFDNIGLGLTANPLWVAIANAINNGISPTRGASNYIVASAGIGVTAVASATYSLAAGTDGTTTITGATLVGLDTTPRKGMYSLRNTKASVVVLADCDDSTTWTTQESYGLSEGSYMVATGPAGDTVANAATTIATAGINNYAIKVLFGDWIYWADPVNQITRLISPQGFSAGLLSNQSPQNSSLNKQMYGIVSTQRILQNLPYSNAELQVLGGAGIDVITNPVPGGSYFGARFGHNTSSNAAVHGDNYTRMTNYLAATLNAGMGLFVGQLQSAKPTDTTRAAVKATIDSFLASLVQQGMIDDFFTKCDLTNNLANRIALGYLQIDVKVRYLAVVEFLLINLEGGQSVSIVRQSTQPQ